MKLFSKKNNKIKINEYVYSNRNLNGYCKKTNKLKILETRLETRKEFIKVKKVLLLSLYILFN